MDGGCLSKVPTVASHIEPLDMVKDGETDFTKDGEERKVREFDFLSGPTSGIWKMPMIFCS